jgi:hypothetical protein
MEVTERTDSDQLAESKSKESDKVKGKDSKEALGILPGPGDDIDLQSPPIVNSVVPNTGTTNGGDRVTINGSNFRSGSTVSFGTSPGLNTTPVDRQTLMSTTPPHVAGNVKVRVTNQGSGLTGTLNAGFTYIQAPAPALSRITPAVIPALPPPPTIAAVGSNFVRGSVVLVAGQSITPAFDSSTQVRFVPPRMQPGAIVQVSVQNPDGQTSGVLTLRYL